MIKFIRTIKQNNYFYLIQQFTITDFKLRYSHSVLGYLWSLLNPLLMFGVLYFIFSVFMRFGGIEHYQVYLLSGIMLYNFFDETTSSGITSLFTKSSLLNKVNFPRIIIPLSSTLANTITATLNMVILAIFIAFSGVNVGYSAFLSLLILFELILISLGVSLFLCSFYLKFRDLEHIWGVILRLGFWATPIIYPIDIVPIKYHIIFKINPMARLIQNFRMAVIMGQVPGMRNIIYNIAMTFLIFFVGYIIFQKRQKYFAEWL
jgi:ABC-type polysaccharide/polyol phosphate export permease